MAAVMGLLAVTVVISAVVLTASVNSLTYTSSTRSSVQAQAAADGGVDATLADLKAGTCVPTRQVDSSPAYKSSVSYRTASTASWTDGCPTASTPAVQVKVVSVGYPTGVAVGTARAVTRSSEAVYLWSAPTGSAAPGGPAVYAFDAAGFGGSGKLVSVNGSDPDIMVKQGDVDCSGGGSMQGDLIVDGGSLTVSGSCGVGGNLWASGLVYLSGDVPVGGNIVAPSLLSTGGKIGGSTWTTGNTKVSWGSVTNGGATASTLTLAGGNVKGSAWSSGATTWEGGGLSIDGKLTAKSVSGTGTAKGGVSTVPAGPGPGPSAPSKPVVPNWVDFASTASDWAGYTVKTLSTCDYNSVQSAVNSLGTSKGLIDARACSVFSIGSYQKVTMSSDLVIVAKSYNLGGSAGFVASAPRKLWLITPDDTKNGAPNCPGATSSNPNPSASSFTIDGGFTFSNTGDTTRSNIAAMLYSPCRIVLASGLKVWGQIFAGQAGISGDATLAYVPIGLPGYDLNTGNASGGSGASAGTLGGLVSRRDVAGG